MLRPIQAPEPARFAEPTPLGLFGLAVGCAALCPIAFGLKLGPTALTTAAMYCLLFGGGCQLLAGLMSFANHNLYGGTLFTAFAFNWAFNWWVLDALAHGVVPDHTVVMSTEICFLVIFLVLTYGFGFYSRLLFLFLLDIDLLFAFKLLNAALGTRAFAPAVAACTVALALVSLWIAFGLMINPTVGRPLFPTGGPLFTPTPAPGFDFGAREAIFGALYAHWQTAAFEPLPVDALAAAVASRADAGRLLPELAYLEERGAVALSRPDGDAPSGARLTASGIDRWERTYLGKP